MKKGLKIWSSNTEFYLPEAVRLYRAGVFDYIELYVVPDTLEFLPQWSKLEIPYIIHNAHFAQKFNLAVREQKARNYAIYLQSKAYADELNALYIIFHGGISGNIEETAEQLASFNEPRALIENKPYRALPQMGGEVCRGYNLAELQTVIKAAKCGFCLDFGHAVCAANSLKCEVYQYIKDLLVLKPAMFHLTDLKDIKSDLDSHLHLGEGQLDFSRVMPLIPPDGIVTFETNKNSNQNLNDFIGDMQWLKNLK